MPRSPLLPSDPAPVLVRRFAQLFAGLLLYGIGIALIVQGDLGVAPWDVLSQGIAKQTGWSFGLMWVIAVVHWARPRFDTGAPSR